MTAFEFVVVVVAVAAIASGALYAVGLIPRPKRVRRGTTWIDHAEDIDLAQRPSEDAMDDPLPRRAIRPRPARGPR